MLTRLNRRSKLPLACAALTFAPLISGCSHAERRTSPDAAAQSAALDSAARAQPLASSTHPSTEVDGAVEMVSAASPPWNDGPAITTNASDGGLDGVVDGARLRAKNRARLAADKSEVTLLQGDDVRALGRRICEASVPKRAADTPILIKPNIGGFEWFRDANANGGDDGLKGRITQPEFVRGIVQCLKARGHAKITIAEGWGASHKDWLHLIAASGYEAMAKEENVPLVAMDDDGVFDVEGEMPGKPLKVNGMEKTEMPTLLMPKILAEHLAHGLFISAPKLKAHRFGVVSIGTKGMQGVVMTSDASPAFHQKWRSHRELSAALTATKKNDPDARKQYVKSLELFSERMTDMLEVAAPDVVLAEGAPAMGGDGFGQRFPMPNNVAIGGTNVVLVDRVGAEFLGLWNNEALGRELLGHKTSPLIESASKRFNVDISAPVVVGDGASLLAVKRPVHLIGMAGFEITGDDARPQIVAAHAASSTSAPPSENGSSGIKIDGNADEAAWKKAQPVVFDTDYAGKPTAIRTTVRALWGDALYLAFDLENAGLNVDPEKPVEVERAGLYQEDCVEIFLCPVASERRHYFEMEIGPRGHFFDLDVDRRPDANGHVRANGDASFSAGLEIKTRVDENAHTAHIEVAARAKDVVALLVANARLPLGIFRIEGTAPRRSFLAWSPPRTSHPDFHVPDAFGTVLLAP